jgi:hypothetical protein
VSETGGTANLTTTVSGRLRMAAGVVQCSPPEQPMTSMRAAAYVGGGALLVAWFAAAASSPVQDLAPPRDLSSRTTPTAGSSSLAAEVQAQATRLRERLAQAPAPQIHPRNPFSFAPVPSPRVPAPSPRVAALEATPAPAAPAVPALSLMGIAAEASPEGLHRTAIIGGADDALYMVVRGQTFADRYRVTAIGEDAVELRDLVTGGYRRLALR